MELFEPSSPNSSKVVPVTEISSKKSFKTPTFVEKHDLKLDEYFQAFNIEAQASDTIKVVFENGESYPLNWEFFLEHIGLGEKVACYLVTYHYFSFLVQKDI